MLRALTRAWPVILGLLFVANLFLEGGRLLPAARAADTHEYKVVPYDASNREAILNQYGRAGWELVAIDPAHGGFIFERQ
jgi:hypothetical protein